MLRVALLLLIAFPASAAASGRATLVSDVADAVGATSVTVRECEAVGAHLRCAGLLDVAWDDETLQRCRFVARLYPHGMRHGDADGFVDLKIGRCAVTSKLAMVRRQFGVQRRAGGHVFPRS